MPDVTVWQTGSQPFARYYTNDKSSSIPDEEKAFRIKNTGAGFWYLSSREYGKFIANLRAGKAGDQVWNSMVKASGPGDAFQAGMFKRGGFPAHNGGWGPPGGPGIRSGWAAFPDGVTAVVTNNSPGAIGDALNQMVDAYDNA